jgi:hypothetical protein
MKNYMTTFIVGCLIACVQAAEKPVRFYNLTGQDQALLDETAAFLTHHTRIPVENGTLEVKSEASNAAQAAALSGKLTEAAIAHVVFINAGPNEKEHTHVDPKHLLVIVNLAGTRTDNAKAYGRRIDRQVMKGVFTVFGRGPCPNPQCVLFEYKDLTQMDQIGRGPCPPCLIAGIAAAQTKGAKQVKTPLELMIEQQKAGKADTPAPKGEK